MKQIMFLCLAGILSFATELSIQKGSYEYANGLYRHNKFNEAYLAFKELCQNQNQKACTMLGIMEFNGQGISKNQDNAIDIFKTQCDKNEAMACGKLGELYAYGFGGKVPLETKQSVLQKACKGGYTPACDLAK